MYINIHLPFEQAVEAIGLLNRSTNSWAQDLRKASLIAARTLPMPEAKSGDWRNINPNRLFPGQDLNLASEETVYTQFISWNNDSNRLEEEVWQNTDKIKVLPMWQAFEQFPQLVKSYFRGDQHQKDLSCALIGALSTGGAYIHLEDEAHWDRPLHICHKVKNTPGKGENFFALHTLVQAQKNSQGTIIESFTDDVKDLLAHSLLEIDLEDDAQLTYIIVSDWSDTTKNLAHVHINMGKGASLKLIFVGLGGSLSKVFFNEDLENSQSNAEIYGLIGADGAQTFDVNTFVHHHVARSRSNVLFSCALSGQSHTIFSGNILVEEAALYTDAYQKNKNLLLSPRAKAESMPKLEIKADDVRCTHGASFTNYDPEQIFYLQSRGLNEEEAKQLIIGGFFREIIEKAEDEIVSNWLSSRLIENFHNIN